MEIGSLNEFIKKAIEYYDDRQYIYKDYMISNDVEFNYDQNEITFYINDTQEKKLFEILGYFDNETKVWVWAWLLSDLNSDQTKICRNLLDYGLKLEPSTNMAEHIFIKSLLLNSRIQIDEFVQLEVNMAIYTYLIKDKIMFIYPVRKYIDEKKEKYITFYYLIKKYNID